ncbi:MAG: Hsp70 family protein [Anaerolineae bacterium]|nr:Hsp70 family protein [Anaerolineae bacterium]
MIVGMDFGTTNSGMSCYDGHTLQLIPLDRANAHPQVARTALYITNRRRIFIGREAVETYYAQNINRKVKYERVWVGEITLNFAELPEFVRDVTVEKDVLSPGRLFLSFKTSLRSPSYLGTVIGTQFYFLEDIVGLYLYTAKQRAEAHLQRELKRIVLGRPVRFSVDPQQDKLAEQRLVHAAFLAGYEEVYLQYEPIAAAYFYETQIDRPQNVVIFDFGGGTLDITIARLGAGEHDILATGGVPIAGDVFDQKLVRATLPPHFGQGTHFISDSRRKLPVPASYFEAFADWQEMLELNKPDILLRLEHMARTAEQPAAINQLISLIRSGYSLKMFDAAETVKRDLSARPVAMLTFDGTGFGVREPVTRQNFETLINEDVRTIAATLDDVMHAAGLRDDQIDAVIRTGGSAQIPVFIQMLERRFGKDKVRAIDTFSSVTSGLGMIGHYIEQGTLDLPGYRRDEWTYGASLRAQKQSHAPTVNLDLMKKFVDLEEREADNAEQQVCIVAVNDDSRVTATTQPRSALGDAAIPLNNLGLDLTPDDLLAVGTPEDRTLVITSEYRFFLRTLQELADLAEVRMTLAQIESFFADKFGREVVTALADWAALQDAERVMLICDQGDAKLLPAANLLPNFHQTYPYQLDRVMGLPVALVPADDADLLLITDGGSVARVYPGALPTGTQRVMRVRKNERIVYAFSLPRAGELILATANGRGKRLHTGVLSLSNDDLGAKVLSGRDLAACAVLQPGAQLWALTTQRMVPLDAHNLPLDPPTPANKRALLRLQLGETLVALHTHS